MRGILREEGGPRNKATVCTSSCEEYLMMLQSLA